MTRCALCGNSLDTDSPYVVYARNPLTFRMAWMHTDCGSDALDCLHGQPASDVNYADRYDEYIHRLD